MALVKNDGGADGRPRGSAMDAALRILGMRDHSVAEMEKKLQSRGFDSADVSEAVEKLIEYKYLDDAKFARLIARSNPGLGRRGLGMQMKKRGIDKEIWAPLVEEIGEDEEFSRALAAARKHTSAEKINSLERQVWKRRLSGYLARRGFSMGVVMAVCSALDAEAQDLETASSSEAFWR